MNKPPGYYRDERGGEYYWDGRQRSYIPENLYRQFKSDVRRATPWVLGASLVPSLPPIALAAILLVVVVIWAVLRSPLALLLLLLIGLGVYAWVAFYENREAEEKRIEAQQRAEADRRRETERPPRPDLAVDPGEPSTTSSFGVSSSHRSRRDRSPVSGRISSTPSRSSPTPGVGSITIVVLLILFILRLNMG